MLLTHPWQSILWYLYPLMVLLSVCESSYGQNAPFPCDGRLILSYNNDNSPPNFLEAISIEDGNIEFDLLNIYNQTTFNATGFNPVDNYIYAHNGTHIIRLFNDGNWEIVVSSPLIAALNTYAGACTPTGKYLLDNRADFKWYLFDLASPNPEVPEETITLTWDPSTGNDGVATLFVDDIAFAPWNPDFAYTFQRNLPNGSSNPAPPNTNGHLLKVNINPSSPDFGKVFSVAPISDPEIKLINAMFFGNDGFLYGYASKTIGPVLSKYLIRIDPETGETETIGTGPVANYLDGCSCLSQVYCGMEVLQDTITCFENEVKIKVFITNRSNSPITNVHFRDTVKQGLKIKSVYHVAYNESFTVHLTPDSVLWFSHIDLDPGDSVIFIITLDMSNAIPGTLYQHMGWLENLPGIPEQQGSDNIHTPAIFSDPVTFFYTRPEEAELPFETDFNLVSCPASPTAVTQVILSGDFIKAENEYVIRYSIHDSGVIESILSATRDSLLEWLIIGNGEIQILQIGLAADSSCTLPLDGNFLAEGTPPDTQRVNLCRNDEYFTIDSTDLPHDADEMQWYASWLSEWQPVSLPLSISTKNIPADGIIGISYLLNDSCEAEKWFQLNLSNAPLLELGNDQTFKGGIPVTVEPEILFDAESLDWIILDGDNEYNCGACESLNFTPIHNGAIIALAQNAAGCFTQDTLFYSVTFDNSIYVPNCFSPNLDGFNDRFFPFFGCSIRHVEVFEIYDRWGELVFRASDYNPQQVKIAWDGTFRGAAMDAGVFVWRLRCSSTDGSIFERAGSVTLLK